jgi:hypothetical protein
MICVESSVMIRFSVSLYPQHVTETSRMKVAAVCLTDTKSEVKIRMVVTVSHHPRRFFRGLC